MKFALSSHVLMAHWVPGFLVVLAVRPALFNNSPLVLKGLLGSENSGGPIAILCVVVLAFVVGEFLDSIRDLLENVWDLFQQVNWEFLVTADKDKVENFKASYFTYYAFDCNASLALLVMLLLAFLNSTPKWAWAVLLVLLAVFVVNAIRLRSEMAPLTRE